MAINFSNEISAPPSENNSSKPSIRFSSGVSNKDRKFFTEQLSLLLETGNSLVDSLEIISSQLENPEMILIVNDIIDQLNGGKSFSAALSSHPIVFSTTYTTLISASESGGYMDKVLQHILDMEEKKEELQSTLLAAFTYPAFLIVFAFAVIIFILSFVFPKFTDMFSGIADELPVVTVILMWLSNLTTQYWWLLLSGFTALIGSFLWLINQESGKRMINDALTRIPILGKMIYEIYLIQSMRIIGLSLDNGVTLVEAIKACKDIAQNSRYQEFINKLFSNVNDGQKFSSGFNDTDFVPSLIKQMVKTGEESGQLALVSTRVADYYQRDLSKRLNSLAKFIEPLMLLFMGVVVGLVVSALILPIFKLSRAVH